MMLYSIYIYYTFALCGISYALFEVYVVFKSSFNHCASQFASFQAAAALITTLHSLYSCWCMLPNCCCLVNIPNYSLACMLQACMLSCCCCFVKALKVLVCMLSAKLLLLLEHCTACAIYYVFDQWHSSARFVHIDLLLICHALQGLHVIPYKELALDATSTIIGHSKYCVIYQAYYCGMAVTVKRLVPPANPKSPTIFKRNSFRVSPSLSPTTSLDVAHEGLRQTQSLDVVRPAALTPALLRSSSIGPVSPIVVGRDSSRPLLPAADWVPSDLQFLEQSQTRNWRLQAQQFWVQTKFAMVYVVGSTYRVISGQYFKTLLLKRRVRVVKA